MTHDAVFAADRYALLQRMVTGRIDLAGDTHDSGRRHSFLDIGRHTGSKRRSSPIMFGASRTYRSAAGGMRNRLAAMDNRSPYSAKRTPEPGLRAGSTLGVSAAFGLPAVARRSAAGPLSSAVCASSCLAEATHCWIEGAAIPGPPRYGHTRHSTRLDWLRRHRARARTPAVPCSRRTR